MTDPTDGSEQEIFDAKKNRKAMMLKKLPIVDDMLPQLQDVENAFTVWTKFKEMHKTTTNMRLFPLKVYFSR